MRAAERMFFSVAQTAGRWWWRTPEGQRFLSRGLNHIDPATAKYPENRDLWHQRYGADEARWRREGVRTRLLDWGFNSIGMVEETACRGGDLHRHSRGWTVEEYRQVGLPFAVMLPLAHIHQWDREHPYPDVGDKAWKQWCDHIGREVCEPLANEPLLLGYFYSDCPTWTHASLSPARRGPWFTPDAFAQPGAAQRTAERYYATIADAVRRYDPNHLLLGDRFNGRVQPPDGLLKIAAAHTDVLSFQWFGEPAQVANDLQRWSELTGKPVLLADARGEPGEYRTRWEALWSTRACIGWHFCGAFMRNRVRGYGLLDEREQEDAAWIPVLKEVHAELEARVAAADGER